MKTFFKYILSVLIPVLAFTACEESAGVEEQVPEGVLRIFADKTSISADGADKVTFRVMFGSEDVSTKNTMRIVKEFNGIEEEMTGGACVFSTTAPGTYKFTATLYSAGEHVSDNEILVTAAPVESMVSYARKVLGEQYTSVGCQSCPSLSAAIKEVQKQMPGVLVPVSFHMDFQVADPMAVDATAAFQKYHGFQGLPYFNLDFHKAAKVETFVASIISAVEEEVQNNPSLCGVAIETTYEESSRSLAIKAKVTSNVAARYKYHIFLLEDGLEYDQMGADKSYRHENVVRKMFAPDVTGMNMNSREAFVPGVEVVAEKSAVLDAAWNPDNMRVVVAALTSLDGEKTWVCNNVNECKVSESVDYVIK